LSGIFFFLAVTFLHRALPGLLLLLAAAACAPSKPAPAPVNLTGFPPAFREGYGDGCASAGGRVRKDAKRFEKDRQYASGWRDGLDACRRRTQKPAS
jgi:hypothetical protein